LQIIYPARKALGAFSKQADFAGVRGKLAIESRQINDPMIRIY